MDTGKDRIKEGDFREWSFPIAEILEWVRSFLRDAGYQILPSQSLGFVTPDIFARRSEGGKTYQIVCIGAQHTDSAVAALTRLAAVRSNLGDRADYVLAMPPISEFLMLQFLREAEGRWYFAMKDAKIMMWLANPDQEFTWCVVGEPQDKVFRGMFAGGKMTVDFLLSRELAANRWNEEEY
ncbi:MAG: hypothetical protein HYX90_00145 [Chloroflexi bacterium]|nr:hypothetical protein [Chloroflexota bacterium]